MAVKAKYVPKVMVSSALRMTGPPQQALQSSWSSQGSDLHSQKRSYEATRAAERMTHKSDRAYAGPQDSLRWKSDLQGTHTEGMRCKSDQLPSYSIEEWLDCCADGACSLG